MMINKGEDRDVSLTNENNVEIVTATQTKETVAKRGSLFNILCIVVLILTGIQVSATGRNGLTSFISQFIGALFAVILVSLILGIVPYLISKSIFHKNSPSITIERFKYNFFIVVTLAVSVITFLGHLYNKGIIN